MSRTLEIEGAARRITFFDFFNVYLIDTPAGPVLVDGAAPGMMPWLRRGLRRHGLAPGDLAAVVVTHFHRDHVGTAHALASHGVPLHALRAELPILRGEAAHPGYGSGLSGRALAWLEHRALAPLRFPQVQAIDAGELLFGSPWRILAAPGHSPGSLALHHEDSGEMLTGDTLVNQLGRARGPHPVFTPDLALARASALALLEREPTRILSGHGPPARPEAYARESDAWRVQGESSAPR